MIVIHVIRKPCSEGSVGRNALKFGTGGINVDGSRVSFSGNEPDSGQNFYRNRNQAMPENRMNYFGGVDMLVRITPSHRGRWPANLILQHRPGCQQTGTTKIKGITGTVAGRGAGKDSSVYNKAWSGMETAGQQTGYVDADGLEEVATWECEGDCPVQWLDGQSADGMHSAGFARKTGNIGGEYVATSYAIDMPRNSDRFGDSGGASRFFKQVGGHGS